jgi:hypothetical protein
MTNTDHGLPEVQTASKRDIAYRVGQAIAVVAGVAAAVLVGSLTVWAIVAIWRAILG